jgi:hypothetical protein
LERFIDADFLPNSANRSLFKAELLWTLSNMAIRLQTNLGSPANRSVALARAIIFKMLTGVPNTHTKKPTTTGGYYWHVGSPDFDATRDSNRNKTGGPQ